MQKVETLNRKGLNDLVKFIFSESDIKFYESYSEMDKELIQINSYLEFDRYFNKLSTNKITHTGFAIYYPETRGKISFKKINLDPKRCKGKTFRYRTDGWGLIFINLKISDFDNEIECNIHVNTKKRAENWSDTYPEFGRPELWEWKIIENKSRKIIRKLKNYAQHRL